MAGVVAVLGVVLGEVEDPPESVPSLPAALSGQSSFVPLWVRGAVVPSDGAAVLGEAEGSGLAAETTATPPATSSSPEIAAVRTARRMPLVFVSAGRTSTDGVGASPGAWRPPLRGT